MKKTKEQLDELVKESTSKSKMKVDKGGRPKKVEPCSVSNKGFETVARSISRDSKMLKCDQLENTPPLFESHSNSTKASTIISLARKAYQTFPLLTRVIETQVDLANTPIVLQGGSQRAKDLYAAWFEKIDLNSIKEQFLREWWRSGNVFFYRFDGFMKSLGVKKIIYNPYQDSEIPMRYMLLDPVNISLKASISYDNSRYFLTLSKDYARQLLSPKTQEEEEFLNSLPKDVVNQIKNQQNALLPLDSKRLHSFFYKKQDYEPFGVPFAYPVLDDIDTKIQWKKWDKIIAESAERMILLITAGDEKHIDYNNLSALQRMFSGDCIKKTLIADYTTKAQWVIPDLNKVLGEQKYAEINRSILDGLNAVLFDGGDKFATASMKIMAYLKVLTEAQQAFLNRFLIPEMRRIAPTFRFRDIPTPVFGTVSIENDVQKSKLFTTLYQLGAITQREMMTAIQSGVLPDPEDSIEQQREFIDLRQQGLFSPVMNNGGLNAPLEEGGRPIGTKESTGELETYAAYDLLNQVISKLKRKYPKIKWEKLQYETAEEITSSIILNESSDNWVSSIESYIKSPKEIPSEDRIAIKQSNQQSLLIGSLFVKSRKKL